LGISNLQNFSRQIFEFKALTRKIFRNKELEAAFGIWLPAWSEESMFFLCREDIRVFKVQLGDHNTMILEERRVNVAGQPSGRKQLSKN
jgi:hypothetical protein